MGRTYTSFVPLSFLCPYLALFALFVDTTCGISRVGWAEIGSQSKKFVSCLFLLYSLANGSSVFVGELRALSSSEGRWWGGGGAKKKKIKPHLHPIFFFLGAPPALPRARGALG